MIILNLQPSLTGQHIPCIFICQYYVSTIIVLLNEILFIAVTRIWPRLLRSTAIASLNQTSNTQYNEMQVALRTEEIPLSSPLPEGRVDSPHCKGRWGIVDCSQPMAFGWELAILPETLSLPDRHWLCKCRWRYYPHALLSIQIGWVANRICLIREKSTWIQRLQPLFEPISWRINPHQMRHKAAEFWL